LSICAFLQDFLSAKNRWGSMNKIANELAKRAGENRLSENYARGARDLRKARVGGE